MNLEQVTPVILTHNEAANIGLALESLAWAPRVVVVDSDSRDATERIARGFANVDFREHPYISHADKCNHALAHLVRSSRWVLFLDADYRVTDALRNEIAALEPAPEVSGYWVPFRYCVDGMPLRGTLYPPRICLFRPERGRFRQHGHTQLLHLDGEIGRLQQAMLHDDRKSTADFATRQRRYAELEAEYLLGLSWSQMGWSKRLRRILVVAPWAAPLYALLGQAVIFDGRRGLRYAWERAQAEWFISGALARRMFLPRRNTGK